MEEQAIQLLEQKRFSELRELLKEMEPFDIAAILEDVPEEQLPLMFRILPKELAADTFVEMDSDMQELLIHSFSDRELKTVMDQIYLDDTVDIIEEMPANVVKRILRHAEPGSVILMHDLTDSSVTAALRVIDALQAQGYEFLTVSELAARSGTALRPGQAYCSFPP